MSRIRSLRRSKSGVGSVLGMIFLVAIAFTTIVPLFLYVNNTNNLYNKTAEEMREFDRERSLESLAVFMYVINNGSALNIQIKNKCALNVQVVRIWIMVNETCYMVTGIPELESEIEPATTRMVACALPSGNKVLKVKVATSRGNIFVAENNPVYVTGETWGWEPFSINICMEADNGWIRRTVFVEYVGPVEGMKWNNTVEVTQLVVGGYAYQSVGVKCDGYYKIQIWEWVGKIKQPKPYFTIVVSVSLEMPSPWVFVPKR